MAIEDKFDEDFIEACFNQIREEVQQTASKAAVLKSRIQEHFDSYAEKKGQKHSVAKVQDVSLETMRKKDGGYTLAIRASSDSHLAPEAAGRICEEYKSMFPWISDVVYPKEK